jgi:hypothetical protein
MLSDEVIKKFLNEEAKRIEQIKNPYLLICDMNIKDYKITEIKDETVIQYSCSFYLTSKIDKNVRMPISRSGQVLASKLTQTLRDKRIDFILENPTK